jgi:transketolase C-terminal domain/subunit
MVCCHRTGGDVTIVTYGTLLENAMDAAKLLEEKGISATVLRLLSVSPLPVVEVAKKLSACHHVVVLEETCTGSGIREALAWQLMKQVSDCRVDGIDLGSQYVTHGNIKNLYESHGLDAQSIANYVQEVLALEN